MTIKYIRIIYWFLNAWAIPLILGATIATAATTSSITETLKTVQLICH